MNTAKKKIKRTAEDFYLVLTLIFLYAPILTIVVLSFNNSKSRTQWDDFTLKWYGQMFKSAAIMDALGNTLFIAFVSALVATTIGTAASIAINNMKRVPRSIVMDTINIPMLNADIVTGISLMLAFIVSGISLGFKAILVTHIIFSIPYVIPSIMPKLKQTSKSTYETTMDLEASPIYAFFKVVFPDILPGALSGSLLTSTMSLDGFTITHLTKDVSISTLSTLIYSKICRGIRPSMYPPSVVIFLVVLILLLIINSVPNKRKGEK